MIVPCFNDGVTLPETVASIDEIEPIEVVVVDDGSSDLTTKTVLDGLEAEGVRVIHHEHNRGLIEARMTGLAATSAPFVFPLDADDCAVAGAGCDGRCSRRRSRRRALLRRLPGVRRVEPRARRASSVDPFRLTYTNEYPISALIRQRSRGGGRLALLGRHPRRLRGLEPMDEARRARVRGVYLGAGRITYRRRLHPAGEMRMLDAGRADHSHLYEQLMEAHPELFERVREHRWASDLSLVRKLALPIRLRRAQAPSLRAAGQGRPGPPGLWTLRR